MNLHQLKIFQAVTRYRSFTRAGEEVLLTQSAVSVQMRQLEESLGTRLFERLGKRIYLTEAGKILEAYTTRIFQTLMEARERIDALKEAGAGNLRVGASSTPGLYILPPIIEKFNRLYPSVPISLTIHTTSRIETLLLENELDFAFTGRKVETGPLLAVPFAEDELFLVASPKHPLAGRRTVRPEDLADQKWVLMEDGSALRSFLEEYLKANSIQYRVYLELNNPEAVKWAIIHGVGIGMISSLAVAEELRDGRVVRLTARSSSHQRTLYYICHKEKTLSAAGRAFTTMVKSQASPVKLEGATLQRV